MSSPRKTGSGAPRLPRIAFRNFNSIEKNSVGVLTTRKSICWATPLICGIAKDERRLGLHFS